jgi:hypothetical protein
LIRASELNARFLLNRIQTIVVSMATVDLQTPIQLPISPRGSIANTSLVLK